MTSRLRGGSAKDEPKPTSLLSSKSRTYLSSGLENREKSMFEGSRNKVSRKDSRGKYDDYPVRSNGKFSDTNGYRSSGERDGLEEEDPDVLYRRSRDHFGSWNIQDILGETRNEKGSGGHERKSRLDLFKSNGVLGGRKIANGGSRSKHKSPDGVGGPDFKDSKDEGYGKSRSPDKLDKKNARERARTKSPIKEVERNAVSSPPYEGEVGYRPGNRALLREIENFGATRRGLARTPTASPEPSSQRRYAGNLSPELRENDKIRSLIDKFKSSEQNDGGRETEQNFRVKIRSGDETVGRKWKDVQGSENPGYRSLEKGARTNGDVAQDFETETGFRKRSDTYSLERKGRRKSQDREEEGKRRSYAYSGSPEGFDVQIQRYERALTGPRKDPELVRKSGSRERRGAEVRRRSSLKIRDEENEVRERNGRHNRPLTPPEDPDPKLERRKPNLVNKEWYDSNRQFANKYLQENSKFRSSDDRNDLDDEPRQTFFGDHGRRSPEEDFHPQGSKVMEGHRREVRGEPISIKIRATQSEDHFGNDKRSKRGVFVTNAEESSTIGRRRRKDEEESLRKRGKDWTSTSTPARKLWSYTEGGAQITDVDNGQPCLKCGDACPGFLQHPWRKNCTSCKCPREAHDVCHEEWVSVRSRLGLKGDEASGFIACDPRDLGLAWAPPGLPSHKVEEYFAMLPDISVPRLGTPGERYRDRQLATQLPKQDLAKAYCRHLAVEHYTSADDFMAARNEIALDIGTVQEVLERGMKCAGCKESLKNGSLAVSAGKLKELYHPGCFECVQCQELLVDLAYCVFNDAIYCERHYAERLKGRCAACDELIFSGEFTRAMNKDWHSGHFCCWQCDESLTGQRYVLRDEHPYCIKCYESVFANGCEECSKTIGIDSKDLSYKDKHWHEACFLCNKCRVSLVDKQFGSKVDKIYCGNCYDAQFASRCDGCGEIFRAGTKKMEYKTRQWHEKCFCCVVCQNPIGTKSFIPREQEIYCSGCYEDKFATRCVKCNKIITSGGVTYKNEPWHRECFTCSNCSTSLAGQRFTSRDEKPYCADCFGELFAKRCTACTKPITGIGGTRFISFEDRHWHNDCFICAGCKTSLVGRGFITDADDIICPECAKQKLM